MNLIDDNFVNHDIDNCPYEFQGRYLLEISFDGSNYGGWQIQPNQKSIQESVSKVISRLYNYQDIDLVGSSRTDAGVHAINFAAAFLVPKQPNIPKSKLFYALNMMLADDIKIKSINEVDINFHARFHALGKAYTYLINLGEPTPFTNRYSLKPKHKLDIEKIELALSILVGTHDFSSFVCSRKDIDDAVRTIFSIKLKKFGDYLAITYIGNGFLYKMIRCLTGALLEIGYSRLSNEQLKTILESKNRSLAPRTASAAGLFLMKVFYNQEDLDNFELDKLPFIS